MLTFDKFRKIYDQINPLYCSLTGFGEPFLNPDIFKMVIYAKKHGSFVKFDTNGILLNKRLANRIIKSGLDILSFSIDAANRKTYKIIRRSDKFDSVINNLKFLIKIRNSKKSALKIHTATVVQKDNLNQLIKIIELLDQIGVDRIATVYVMENNVPKNKESQSKQCRLQLKKVIDKYQKIKSRLKTEVDIVSLEEYVNNRAGYKPKKNACYLPWHSVFITWDGDVFPCCMYYDGQIKLGNVFEEDFKKIWNNSLHQDFRHKLIHHRNELPICTRCEVNEVYTSKIVSTIKKVPFLKLFSERS